MITSNQNEKVKLAKALQGAAKIRRKEDLIVLEGTRLVRDALLTGHQPQFLLLSEGFHDEALERLLKQTGSETLDVSEAVMQHVSDTQQPQGVLGVFPMPRTEIPDPLNHVLILDSIRDPGNLGTILRTAAAAGIEAVLLSPTCADPYNPKVLRSGMGAHFRIAVAGAEWEEINARCKGMAVYMAAGESQQRYDEVDWSRRWAIIIGSEAHGAGDAARQLATTGIRIPMAADTESLNAAVAAGIIMFEATRHKTSFSD